MEQTAVVKSVRQVRCGVVARQHVRRLGAVRRRISDAFSGGGQTKRPSLHTFGGIGRAGAVKNGGASAACGGADPQ